MAKLQAYITAHGIRRGGGRESLLNMLNSLPETYPPFLEGEYAITALFPQSDLPPNLVSNARNIVMQLIQSGNAARGWFAGLSDVVTQLLQRKLPRRSFPTTTRLVFDKNKGLESKIYREILDWRGDEIPVARVTWLANPGYYGSYSLDAMTIALYALYHTTSLEEVVEHVVSLRGDADTTAAIAAQMAAPFYADSESWMPARWEAALPLNVRKETDWYAYHLYVKSLTVERSDAACMESGARGQGTEDVKQEERCGLGIIAPYISLRPLFSFITLLSIPAIGAFLRARDFSFLVLHRLVGPSIPPEKVLVRRYIKVLEAAAAGDLKGFRNAWKEACKDLSDAQIGKVLLETDGNRWTCLQLAAGNGRQQIVSEITDIAKRCSDPHTWSNLLDFVGENSASALLLCVSNGHEDIACQLIREGASLVSKASRGRNIAYQISRNGLLYAAQAIVDVHGADKLVELATERDLLGYDSLMAAALTNHAPACALLIQLGITPSHVSEDGSTPLHAAVRTTNPSPAPTVGKHDSRLGLIQEEEEEAGEGFGVEQSEESTGGGASVGVGEPLRTALAVMGKTSLEVLVEHCTADVIGRADRFGSTALHTACLNTNHAAVRLLLSVFNVEELTAQDNDGMHPTHIAALQLGRSAFVEALGTSAGKDGENRKLVEAMACMRELAEGGYPLDLLDYGDSSILHVLCYSPRRANLEAVRWVLEFVDSSAEYPKERMHNMVQGCDGLGWTCLHQALGTKGECGEETFKLLCKYASNEFVANFDSTLPRKNHDPNFQQRRGAHNRIPLEVRKNLLNGEFSLSGVAKYLKSLARTPRVVVLMGAGVSTSAGIPDFRSSTGLYSDKSSANFFRMEALNTQPDAFFTKLASLILPVIDKKVRPTKAHAFLRVMKDMGWLQRVYTQNIDMLEYGVGLTSADVVECHGSCRRAHCSSEKCTFHVESDSDMDTHFWDKLRAGKNPCCPVCQRHLRPAVTFFGEPLPGEFEQRVQHDLPECDLLLVMGTSLSVYPVAEMPNAVKPMCVRMLIDRQARGCFQDVHPCNIPAADCAGDLRPQWDSNGYRDVFYEGECDEGAEAMAVELGVEGRIGAFFIDNGFVS